MGEQEQLGMFDVEVKPRVVTRRDEYGREVELELRPVPWSEAGMTAGPPMFDGETFVPEFDAARLSGQLAAVYQLMSDGEWRTLAGIGHAVRRVPGCERATEASLSARLRDLRKPRFGAHTVEHRRRGDAEGGFWEYRLVLEEGEANGKQGE